MTVWCLWEPPDRVPGYLRACLRTFERNAGLEVRLLCADDVSVLCPAMRPELAARAPTLGQRSDYYRAHVLAEHGGLWLDLDSVVFRDLRALMDGLTSHEVVARRNRRAQLSTSPLAMRPGPAAHRWVALQAELLEGGKALSWTALGSDALTQACEGTDVQVIPSSEVAPLDWTKAGLLASRWAPTALALQDDPLIVTLYHSQFPPSITEASEDEAISSNLMLGRLLRVALGDAVPVKGWPAHTVARMLHSAHGPWRRLRRRFGLRR